MSECPFCLHCHIKNYIGRGPSSNAIDTHQGHVERGRQNRLGDDLYRMCETCGNSPGDCVCGVQPMNWKEASHEQ